MKKIPVLTKKRLLSSGKYKDLYKVAHKYGLNIITISPYGNAMFRKMSEYENSDKYKSLTDNIIFYEKESIYINFI